MIDVQVYGCFHDHWSHAQVSRGVTAGLLASGLAAQIFSVRFGGNYTDLWFNTSSSWQVEAPVGLFIGGYPTMIGNWLESHPFKAALVITETERIPIEWIVALANIDLVIVPSEWAFQAYASAGIPREKLLVAPHGLHPTYVTGAKAAEPKRRRFLHICGTPTFLERKGTPQLIEAWANTPDDWRLNIRGRGERLQALIAHSPVAHRITYQPSVVSLSPGRMHQLLRLPGWSAVIQPSRAEAFGLIPLEARALGLPVVLTHCTGHLQHAHEADYVIAHGAPASIQTNGSTYGLAPSISSGDIGVALQELQRDLDAFGRGRTAVISRAEWSWERVTLPLAERLRAAARIYAPVHRILDEEVFG